MSGKVDHNVIIMPSSNIVKNKSTSHQVQNAAYMSGKDPKVIKTEIDQAIEDTNMDALMNPPHGLGDKPIQNYINVKGATQVYDKYKYGKTSEDDENGEDVGQDPMAVDFRAPTLFDDNEIDEFNSLVADINFADDMSGAGRSDEFNMEFSEPTDDSEPALPNDSSETFNFDETTPESIAAIGNSDVQDGSDISGAFSQI